MVSIRIKLIVFSLLIALLPLLVLGIINISKTTDVVGSTTEESLDTIVKSKESALEAYIVSTEKIAKSVSDSDIVQEYISYLNRELSEEEEVQFKLAEKQVDNMIYSFMEAHWGVEYHHIFITDVSGKIILSPNHGETEKGSPSSHLNSDISENHWFEGALTSTQITDYSTWAESNHFHQLLLYPLRDSSGNTQGVIGYELMISHENDILNNNFKMGETGKVFLSSLEGVEVVHLKEDLNGPLDSEGISRAIDLGYSSGITLNSEGIEVIGFYLKNEKYPWVLVAEIETEEAFKGTLEIRENMIFGIVITSIIVVILTIFLSGIIIRPVKVMISKAEELYKAVGVAPPKQKGDEIQTLTEGISGVLAMVETLLSDINIKKKRGKK